jgi:hypothetical protein
MALFCGGSFLWAEAKTSNSRWGDLAKPRAVMLTHLRHGAVHSDEGNRPMKMLAYLLAIICVIAAVMYFVMPAGQLPTFMPGYIAGSSHIHTTHAIAAAVAAVILLVIGWFMGRR